MNETNEELSDFFAVRAVHATLMKFPQLSSPIYNKTEASD